MAYKFISQNEINPMRGEKTYTSSPQKIITTSIRGSKTHYLSHSDKITQTYKNSIPITNIIILQHSNSSPAAPSNTTSENPTGIYDIDI